MDEARRMAPAASGTREETARGVLARILAGLGCPLVVLQPPERRDELRALALHAAWLAGRTEP